MDTGLLSVVIGVVGLVFAFLLFIWIKGKPTGTELMKEISDVIHAGAMVFLKREYSILVIFIIIVFALLSWKIQLEKGFWPGQSSIHSFLRWSCYGDVGGFSGFAWSWHCLLFVW